METNRVGAYDAIASLARESGSDAAFLASALEPIAESLGCLYAVLTARLSSQVVDERWHAPGADADFWKQPTEELLTRVLETAQPCGRSYRGRESLMTVAALAAPLRKSSGGCDGAVVILAPCAGEWEARETQAALESLTHLVSGLRSRFEEGGGRDAMPAALEGAAHLSKVSAYSTPRELAFALANNLRVRTHCDQVALGVGSKGRVEILCISGYDEVKSESPGTGELRAAMEECLDADERVVTQEEREWAGEPLSTPHRLHRQWHDHCGRAAVASLPIPLDDRRRVILSLRRPAGEPFREEDLRDVLELVEPFVGALGLLERSARSLPSHAWDDLRAAAAALTAPGHLVRKAGIGVLAALALTVFFGSVPYRLSVPTTVRSAESRHLAAPYEAVLESIAVVPGDRVEAGQVMASFQREELLLELERLRASRAVEDLGAREGMAGRAPHEVEMARARQRLLAAQIASTEKRIAAATLRAPFAGLVVAGDLRTRVGERFPVGEPLFELAAGELRLELEVPEYAAADLEIAQLGEFASHARPADVQSFEIVRVDPSAVARKGKGVYLAEASMAPGESWMRPGIEGVGKIQIGERSIVWVLFHRISDYLWLRFWL